MFDLFQRVRWFLAVVIGAFILGVAVFSLGAVGNSISDAIQLIVSILALLLPVAVTARDESRRIRDDYPPGVPRPTGPVILVVLCLLAVIVIGGSSGAAYWQYIHKPDLRVADQISVTNGMNVFDGGTASLNFPAALEHRDMLYLVLRMDGSGTSATSGNCVTPGTLRIEYLRDGFASVAADAYRNSSDPLRIDISDASRISVRATYAAPTRECSVNVAIVDAVLYNPFP